MRTWQWGMLVVLAGVVFWPVLTTPFIQDDYVFLERALEPHRLAESFTQLRGFHSYRPLSTDLLFTGLYRVFGRHALPFHLLGLVVHVLVARILYALLLSLGVSTRTSRLGALAFLFHPLALWVLMWTACLQETTSTAFGYGCLLLGTLASTAGRARGRAVGAAVSLALALLCKETAIVFAGILFVLLLARRVRAGRALAIAAPSLVVTLAYLVFRLNLGGIPAGTQYEMKFGAFAIGRLGDHLAWGGSVLLAPLWIVIAFVRKIPGVLALTSDLPTLRPFLALAVLGFLALAVVRGRRTGFSGRFAAGLVWWIAGFLPVIFLSVKHYAYYGYASLGGLILAASPLLDSVAAALDRRRIAAGALALLVVVGVHLQARLFSRDHYFPNRARLVESLGRTLGEIIPDPPKDSVFYIRGLPNRSGWFVGRDSGSSSALRVFYRDLTLDSPMIIPPWENIRHSPRPTLFFEYHDGRLVQTDRLP